MSNTTRRATTRNYNIAKKIRKNPRQQVYCFDCKVALRPFIFNNGSILLRLDYGAAVKLEITYIGEVT